MDLSTYSGLQAAIETWLDRDDLTAEIPTFIALAETAINLKIDHRKMETKVTLTPIDSVCTLPDDFLKARRVSYGVNRKTLLGATPDVADEHYYNSGAVTSAFTIVGNSLNLYPDGSEDVELTYIQKVPALSATNTSNWLLAEAPHLYLYATRAIASDFIGDEAGHAQNLGLAAQIVSSLNEQSDLAQFSKMRYMPKGVTP